ncbi:hypothetical protein [Paenibacillus thermotolerans]|uniref:hypothetical protein n=1 Tax=Paenibacillus thermotolerans TaxID=3027807 RepID=UPI0023688417|nr:MULTISPECIES: hypothetical protein [unclassified Paenibacillus]
MERNEALELINQHVNKYVLVQLNDGSSIDGIIAESDGDNVYLAVPMTEARALTGVGLGGLGLPIPGLYPGYPGYYPPYGGYGGYGGYPHFGGYPGYPGYFPPYGGYPVYGGYPGYSGFGHYHHGPHRGSFERLPLPLAAICSVSPIPYY